MRAGEKKTEIVIPETRELAMKTSILEIFENVFPLTIINLMLAYLMIDEKIILAAYLLDETQKPHDMFEQLASPRNPYKEDEIDHFNFFIIQSIRKILFAIVNQEVFVAPSSVWREKELKFSKQKFTDPSAALMELMEIKSRPESYSDNQTSFRNVIESQETFFQEKNEEILFEIYDALMYLAGYARVTMDINPHVVYPALLYDLLLSRIARLCKKDKNDVDGLVIEQLFYLVIHNINTTTPKPPKMNLFPLHESSSEYNTYFFKPQEYDSLVTAINEEIVLFKTKAKARLQQYLQLPISREPLFCGEKKKTAILDLIKELDIIDEDSLLTDLAVFVKKLSEYKEISLSLYEPKKEFANTLDDIREYMDELCEGADIVDESYLQNFNFKTEEPFEKEIAEYSKRFS